MAKTILSGVPPLAVLLAAMIASRSEMRPSAPRLLPRLVIDGRRAVGRVARRIDDDDAGRGGGDVGRELRGAAVVAAAQIDRGGGGDAVAAVDPDVGQRGVDRRVARAVGGDGDEAQVALAFAVGRIGDARPVGEELDAVRRVGVAVERAGDRRAGRVGVRAGQHRKVLQVVGAGVAVAGVVGGDAAACRGRCPDSPLREIELPSSALPPCRSRDSPRRRRRRCWRSGCPGRQRCRRSGSCGVAPDLHAVAGIAERRRAIGVDADVVALHDVVVCVDAEASRRCPKSRCVRRSWCRRRCCRWPDVELDAVVGVADVPQARGIGANVVANDQVAGAARSGDLDALQVAGDARCGRPPPMPPIVLLAPSTMTPLAVLPSPATFAPVALRLPM